MILKCDKMISSDELMDKYRDLIVDPSIGVVNDEGQIITVLCETSWTRVLLIRDSKVADSVSIEVELSLPGSASELLGFSNRSPGKESDSTVVVKELAETMIAHLQYLLNLHSIGFSLEAIADHCMWIAEKTLDDIPEIEVFELLVPPQREKSS